jgi:hypothetical protein
MPGAFARRLEQAALHRIIINNHDSTGHGPWFLVLAMRSNGHRSESLQCQANLKIGFREKIAF